MSMLDFAKTTAQHLRQAVRSPLQLRARWRRRRPVLAASVLALSCVISNVAAANCQPWQRDCNGTAMNGGTIDGYGNTWTSNLNGGYTDQNGRTWTKGVNDDWKRSDGYSVHENMGGGYTDSKGENFSQGMSTGWVGDRGTNCTQQVSGNWYCN